MGKEYLHCLAVGTLTGYDFVFDIRQDFGGNCHGFTGAEEIGAIDAPYRTAAGSCVRVDNNENITCVQSQVWRP